MKMNVFQISGFAKSTVVSIKLLYQNNACEYTRNPVFTANRTAGLLIKDVKKNCILHYDRQ